MNYGAKPGVRSQGQRVAVLTMTKRPRLCRNQIADRHGRAAKAFGDLLTAADVHLWIKGTYVWIARLTLQERRDLTMSVALSLDPDDFAEVALTVMGAGDHPTPAYLDPTEEARFWAQMANVAEHRAYTMAGFMALSPADKKAFIATASRIAGGAG